MSNKKYSKGIAASAIAFILVVTMLPATVFAVEGPEDTGSVDIPISAASSEEDVADISLVWINDSKTTGIWTSLNVSPDTSSYYYYTGLLTFSLKTLGTEGPTVAKAGTIEIVLPQYLFVQGPGRLSAGAPFGYINLGLGNAGVLHESGFYFQYVGTDVVIRNHEDIDDSTVFECQFSYFVNSCWIESGRTFSLSAKYKVGEETGEADPITFTFNTNVDIGNNNIQWLETRENWPSELNASLQSNLAPGTTAKDYVYALYRIDCSPGPKITQSYSSELSYPSSLNPLGGIIVGTHYENNYTFPGYGVFAAASKERYLDNPSIYATGYSTNYYTVVAIPRDKLAANDNVLSTMLLVEQIGNDYDPDGLDIEKYAPMYASKELSHSYIYTPPEVIYYPGDRNVVEKTYWTSLPGGADRSYMNEYHAPLSFLLNDEPVALERFKTANTPSYLSVGFLPLYVLTAEQRQYSLTQDLTGLTHTLNQSVSINVTVPSGSRVMYTGTLSNNSSDPWTLPSLTTTLPNGFSLDDESVTINGVLSKNTPFLHKYTAASRILMIGFDEIAPGATVSFSFEAEAISGSASATPLAIEIGGNYGKKNYTTELVDDLMFIDGKKLAPEDYSITHFTGWATESNLVESDSGEMKSAISTVWESYSDVDVFVKTATNPSWEKIGTVKRIKDDAHYSDFIPVSGPTQRIMTPTIAYFETMESSAYPSVELPENTYALKLSHTGNKYETKLRADIKVRLNPTDSIKEKVRDLDEKAGISLTNISTSTVKDYEGNYQPVSNNDNMKSLTQSVTDAIVSEDKAEARPENSGHASKTDAIRPMKNGKSYITKWPTSVYTTIGWAELTYDVVVRDYVSIASYENVESYVDAGFFYPQTDGMLYDLLPPGMVYVPNSVVVTPEGAPGPVSPVSSDYITVETIPNWMNGRTLLKIHVSLPGGTDNIYDERSSGFTVSGFHFVFKAINPVDNLVDNGTKVENNAVYKTNNAPYMSATRDAGSHPSGVSNYTATPFREEFFEAVCKESGGYKDCLPAFNICDISMIAAATTGLTNKVKAENEPVCGNSTATFAAGTYTYQLRFATGTENTQISDLIMYDVLEDYDQPGPSWKGTLENIDLSHALGKGIDAIPYYSTKPGLDPYTSPGDADIANPEIWSATPPSDLSTVTAIAIDLRKKTDGDPYIMKESSSVYVTVTMRAPADISELLGTFAYNRASYSLISSISGSPDPTKVQTAYSQVSLRASNLNIEKTSNPVSGTSESPAPVVTDGAIEYTITVRNNEEVPLTDIEIEDIVPDGLRINLSGISYYYGSLSPAPVTDSSTPVSVSSSGQKLTFTVDSIPVKNTLNIIIPVTVDTPYKEVFENEAKMTKLNGMDYIVSSNKTYHENASGYTLYKATVYLYKDDVPWPDLDHGKLITLVDSLGASHPNGSKQLPGIYKIFIDGENTGETIEIVDEDAEKILHYYTLTLTKDAGITSIAGADVYRAGQEVTINAVVAAGNTWVKWVDLSDKGFGDKTTRYYVFTMPAFPLALEATSAAVLLSVTYNANGGLYPPVDNNRYRSGNTVVTRYKENLIRPGYTFLGWGLSNTSVTYAEGQRFIIFTNTTLYAIWEEYIAPPPPTTPPPEEPPPPPPPIVDPPQPPPPPIVDPVDEEEEGIIPVIPVTNDPEPLTSDPPPIVIDEPATPEIMNTTEELYAQLKDNGVPLIGIEGLAVPLYTIGGIPAWALINLILCILGALFALVTVIRYHARKNDDEDEETYRKTQENGEEEKVNTRRPVWLWATGILAVVGVIVFILTEDMRLPMVLLDRWTIVNAIVFIAGLFAIRLTFKRQEEEEEIEGIEGMDPLKD